MAHTTAAIYLRSTLLVLLMTVVVAAGCDSPKSAPSPQHSGGKHPGTQQAGAELPEFNPDTITQPFAVIKDVPIESADVASIGDDALVLGVIVNEQARAYPVSALETPQREIVNDQLGEAAIAATW